MDKQKEYKKVMNSVCGNYSISSYHKIIIRSISEWCHTVESWNKPKIGIDGR